MNVQNQASTSTHHSELYRLNALLRAELSARDCVEIVLGLELEPLIRAQLNAAHQSHEKRIQLLEDRVHQLGGRPSQNAGAWGAIAKSREKLASILGLSQALRSLARQEDVLSTDYEEARSKLSQSGRAFLISTVLPEQQRTQSITQRLLKQMLEED